MVAKKQNSRRKQSFENKIIRRVNRIAEVICVIKMK